MSAWQNIDAMVTAWIKFLNKHFKPIHKKQPFVIYEDCFPIIYFIYFFFIHTEQPLLCIHIYIYISHRFKYLTITAIIVFFLLQSWKNIYIMTKKSAWSVCDWKIKSMLMFVVGNLEICNFYFPLTWGLRQKMCIDCITISMIINVEWCYWRL